MRTLAQNTWDTVNGGGASLRVPFYFGEDGRCLACEDVGKRPRRRIGRLDADRRETEGHRPEQQAQRRNLDLRAATHTPAMGSFHWIRMLLLAAQCLGRGIRRKGHQRTIPF